jgi:hypothetical protein
MNRRLDPLMPLRGAISSFLGGHGSGGVGHTSWCWRWRVRSFVVVTDKTDLGWEHRHVMFPNKDSESQRKKAQEMSTLNLLGHW